MKAKIFKSVIERIFNPALSSLGYEIDMSPPGYKEDVCFEKKLQEGVYILIDIQPSPLELNDFTMFAINLRRNAFIDSFYRKWQTTHDYLLDERLASCLWIKDNYDPQWKSDHWWHFQNEAELETVCSDALDKLLHYGIPYLEDLRSKSFRFQK